MSRSFRNLAATLGCAAALASTLLSGCGPSTSVPPNFATCKTPSVICLPSGSSAGLCVDISSDPNNCGECGNVCGVPQQGGVASCIAGECVSSCSAGLTVCGVTTDLDGGGTGAAICIDTTVDPNHCGSCDTRCLGNQVCTAGACVSAGADAGTTVCSFGADGGPVYAQLNNDPANCGACGNVCGNTEICLSGTCSPCDVAQCGNVCVNTNTDPNNCGSCGAVVPSGGACDNGTPRPLPVITVLPPASSGFLPTGNPTFSVSVKSAIRLAQVTALAKLTRNGVTSPSSVFNLTLASDANFSPTNWTFTWSALPTAAGGTLPALAVGDTLEIDLNAYDEQYMSTRADAAQHTSALVWTGAVVVPVPVNLAIPTAATTVLTAANTALPAQSWVPLNGAPITFTESPTSTPTTNSYISGVQFRSSGGGGTNILGGAGSFIPFTNGSATITVNPADLGTGTRSIVAYQIDYFGNALNPSSPLALTVGDITLNAGSPVQPILAHGTDGSDSIWLLGAAQATTPAGSVCAGPANYLVQAFDQPASSPTSVGKTVEGTNFFCQGSFLETFESTGVYGVLATGAGISRFDGPSAITDGFITPQGTNKIARIEPGSITAVALAVDDFTTDGGSGNGAFALAAKGSSANVEQEAGGADGGSFYAVPPVGGTVAATIRTSTSGALWGWVQVPTGNTTPGQNVQYQLDLFHPAISNNSTQIKSYLATGSTGSATPISLSVFPGGEYVWEEVDASTGFLTMGGGRFDGTNQPVDLTNASASAVTMNGNAFEIGVQHTLTSTAFFVPSPGILVGLVPSRAGVGSGAASTSAGYEVVEIDVTGTQAKIYHPPPIQVNGTTPSGEVLLSGVTDRFGNFNTFTVSDDLKKVLYVTKATSAAPAKDTYTINMLDLATGTSSPIYSSQFINNDDKTNNGGAGALTVYPHFLHGVNSYAGLGAASTTPTIVRWNEELPVASGTATGTVYERLFYENYGSATPTPVQVDHLAFASYQGSPPGLTSLLGGSTVPVGQVVAESVKADAIYFLSDDGGGELSLYSRAFDGSGAATLVTKGVSAWTLREDIGTQVVLRVDGTLFEGALSPGGALAAIYKSDSGGEALNLSLAPLAGITGDGTSAFVVVHADQIYDVFGMTAAPFLTGDLVTLNLTTGVRTNWGPAYGYLLEVSGSPFVELGSGASEALYGLDLASPTSVLGRMYSATAAAPTAHKSIFGPTSFGNFSAVVTSYSADAKEALFAPFNSVGYDVTSDPTTAAPFGPAFTLTGPAAQAQPNLAVYGPPRLPLWAFSSVSGSVLFKPFGGTYQAPITVSKTGSAAYVTANNRLTPDFTQLLAHFTDTSGGQPFVMKLPGTGVAPIVLPPQ